MIARELFFPERLFRVSGTPLYLSVSTVDVRRWKSAEWRNPLMSLQLIPVVVSSSQILRRFQLHVVNLSQIELSPKMNGFILHSILKV